MGNEPRIEINEADLEPLRVQPDAVAIIASLLGAKEMRPADEVRTTYEVRQYVFSGSPGEAHALIQNAKMRRELWLREQLEDDLPSTG